MKQAERHDAAGDPSNGDAINAAAFILDSVKATNSAIQCGRTVVSSIDFRRLVAAYARGLTSAGIQRGKIVAILMNDTPNALALALGTMASGGVALLLPVRAQPDGLAQVLEWTQPFALCFDDAFSHLASSVAGICPYAVELIEPSTLMIWSIIDAPLEPVAMEPSEPAFCLATSGTSGSPKITVHHHGGIRQCLSYPSEILNMASGDRILLTSRLSFAYALGIAFGALKLGATLLLIEAWPTTAAVVDAISQLRPTIVFSVPALYRQLLDVGLSTDIEIEANAIRHWISAGERLPPLLAARWKSIFGCEILDSMGCSESIYMLIVNPPGRAKTGASGVAAPQVDVRITTIGDVIEGSDAVGLLEVRIQSLCLGYWVKEGIDRPAKRFVQGWFRTGDLYSRDVDGYYYHCGRYDDMLRVSGQWVQPNEIEDVALLVDAVAEVAAVQAFGHSGLTEIRLCIVPKQGHHDGEEVISATRMKLAGALPGHKQPRQFCIMSSLPRTATGKLQRYRLKDSISITSSGER